MFVAKGERIDFIQPKKTTRQLLINHFGESPMEPPKKTIRNPTKSIISYPL